MNISRRSVFNKLYEYTYFKSPENNFCPFFWYSLIAIIILPITFITNVTKCYRIADYYYNSIENGTRNNFLVLVVRVTSFFMFTLLISILLLNVCFLISGIYQNPMRALYVISIIVGLIISIVFGITGFAFITSKNVYKDTKNIIKTKKESVMDKYCPKINWKD